MASIRHDHIIAYARDANQALTRFHLLPMNPEALARYKNPDNDPRGLWKSDPATAQAGHATKSQFYIVKAPNGKRHKLPSGRCWVFTENVMKEAIADQRIYFGKTGNNVPRIKTFLESKERGLTPETILFAKDASTNEDAKNALKELFEGEALFETPKPVELIVQFLRMCTKDDDLILDSFAGSGTTGHAVLQQNKDDGGKRRFILIEMDQKIARSVTADRMRRAIKGYANMPGLPGGFRYCVLGEPLFDEQGKIRAVVKYRNLAHHVYFAETGEPLPKQNGKHFPLLGVQDGRAIYLLFNGILGDKSAQGGNVLTAATLEKLPKYEGLRVVYGTACSLSPARLKRESILFKQIPYQIKTC